MTKFNTATPLYTYWAYLNTAKLDHMNDSSFSDKEKLYEILLALSIEYT